MSGAWFRRFVRRYRARIRRDVAFYLGFAALMFAFRNDVASALIFPVVIVGMIHVRDLMFPPTDVARSERADDAVRERVELRTSTGRRHLHTDTAGLGDTEVVDRWLDDLGGDPMKEVQVFRHWGTLVANIDAQGQPTVILAAKDRAYSAELQPAADKDAAFSSAEMKRVMLDSLNSPGRPRWPRWDPLN